MENVKTTERRIRNTMPLADRQTTKPVSVQELYYRTQQEQQQQ